MTERESSGGRRAFVGLADGAIGRAESALLALMSSTVGGDVTLAECGAVAVAVWRVFKALAGLRRVVGRIDVGVLDGDN